MQVVQTDGEPPNCGRTIRAIIGWTRNRSAAATRMVTAESVAARRSFKVGATPRLQPLGKCE